jgi:site-specific DNA recombinase
MKQYFAYTRVSTVKQGEHGVSLQEQKAEIERYAHQRGLMITEWIEERETAAKAGRTLFNAMMSRLRKGEAAGVIIHKIDRSARNLRDWVDIGQLTDDGIEVHFTREALDLQSSSGRLSADVQAVVAANYIRNLREETIKGFYGRLRQGISPLPAPLGYIDAGRGKPKTIDPVRGPLVREAFRLYATDRFSHFTLREHVVSLGLKTKRGEPVSKNTLAGMLANPFYYGLIRIEKNNQTFVGIHEPLISKALFDKVRRVSSGKSQGTGSNQKRSFLFSRLIRCQHCGRSLIAELQKGNVYYRCHSPECKGTSLREDYIDRSISQRLGALELKPVDLIELEGYVNAKRSCADKIQHEQLCQHELRLGEIDQRLSRLTDAFLDGHISSEMFQPRKEALLSERLGIAEKLTDLKQDSSHALERMEEFVELVKSASLLYRNGNFDEKRRMVEKTLSNRSVDQNRLLLTLRTELFVVSDRYGDPSAGTSRTFWKRWIDSLTDAKAA